MITEPATGTTTVENKDGTKDSVPYELDLILPEDLDECLTHVVEQDLVKEGEEPEAAVCRGFVDYERRRQRAAIRPSTSRATGAQKFQRAIGKALKAGEVSEEDLAAALASLNVEV